MWASHVDVYRLPILAKRLGNRGPWIVNRFFVNDDHTKVSQVEALLKDKQHKNILLDTVFAEIIWVLSSYYRLEKSDITKKIRALINVESIESNDFLIKHALTIWEAYAIKLF